LNDKNTEKRYQQHRDIERIPDISAERISEMQKIPLDKPDIEPDKHQGSDPKQILPYLLIEYSVMY
jgi:hypothetical protein